MFLCVDGQSLLINLHRATVLHHFNFKGAVRDIVFSPDGRLFAVTHGKKVQLWRTPGTSKEFAPFALFREFPGQYDDAMCIGWSADSRYRSVCNTPAVKSEGGQCVSE